MWFKGECEVTTYGLEELLGSKLRALYLRKKGRDLFDLWFALQKSDANADRIVNAFMVFMEASGSRVPRKQFEANMEAKMKDTAFRGDIAGLLRMNEAFDMDTAWKCVQERIICRLDE